MKDTTRRLRLQSKTHIIEFADDKPGMILAKDWRKTHQNYKGSRIRAGLQMNPELIPIGKEIERPTE